MLRFSIVVIIVGMMVAASAAGEIAQCPVDTVPIQIWDESKPSSKTHLASLGKGFELPEDMLREIDEGRHGPVTTLSAIRISDPEFRGLVTAVTEHIAARLAEEKLCLNSAASKQRSLLQFVRWPFPRYGKDELTAPMPPRYARPAAGGCRISSPWMELAFERRPVPWIHAVIRWNPRQLLADQAALAGAKNVPSGVAMPLQVKELGHFADDYVHLEMSRLPDDRIPGEI